LIPAPVEGIVPVRVGYGAGRCPVDVRGVGEKTLFFTVRLPLMLALIAAGFLFEFLVTLPFRLRCRQGGRVPADRRPGGDRSGR